MTDHDKRPKPKGHCPKPEDAETPPVAQSEIGSVDDPPPPPPENPPPGP